MKFILDLIAGRIAQEVPFEASAILGMFKTPDNAERGDIALPCFPFAKAMKKAPQQLAAELEKLFAGFEAFELVKAEGPFLNFSIRPQWLAEQILPQLLKEKETFGHAKAPAGKTMVIDFSSPNVAKPIGFHHIRSTVIGNALSNIFEAIGWKAVRINYLGDWGTQFGKLIVAYKRWGNEETLKKEKIQHLLDLYVRFHKEVENEPTMDDEARAWFKRSEEKDPEAMRLWKLFREISTEEFSRIYSLLGVRFDHFDGESLYSDRLDATVDLVHKLVGTVVSQGATIVDLEDENMPPCLLRKADGATLYATRDIAAAMDRYERFHYDLSLYVVAIQQSAYFKQLFSVLRRIGFEWHNRLAHVAFGMLHLADKKMSTRSGDFISLEEVLLKSIDLSRQAIQEKNPELAGKEDVARQVGVGAIIFGDLVNRRTNDITFDWEKILNFNGETGVYLQYAYARARSMLRKAGGYDPQKVKPELLDNPIEKDVLKLISQFPEKLEQAAMQYDPSIIARLAIDTARSFNRLYTTAGYRFIADEESIKTARLAFADTVSTFIKNVLALLGVECPEEM